MLGISYHGLLPLSVGVDVGVVLTPHNYGRCEAEKQRTINIYDTCYVGKKTLTHYREKHVEK